MSTPLENFLHEIRNCNKKSLTQDEIFEIVARSQDNQIFIINDLVLNKNKNSIKVGNQEPKRVEKLVFDLLLYMIENENKAVSIPKILNDIWGNDVVVCNRSVTVAMCKLRKVVGDKITTYRKVGYVFER